MTGDDLERRRMTELHRGGRVLAEYMHERGISEWSELIALVDEAGYPTVTERQLLTYLTEGEHKIDYAPPRFWRGISHVLGWGQKERSRFGYLMMVGNRDTDEEVLQFEQYLESQYG